MSAFVDDEFLDWASLPDELLALIFSKLHLFDDIKSFPVVCKAWRPIPQIANGLDSQVLLVSKFLEDAQLRFTNVFGHSYQLDGNDIPELSRAAIYYANDGWLLMSRGHFELFFFHPVTKSIIHLPNVVIFGSSFAFTSNPTSDDCMVFGIHRHLDESVRISVICRGEKKWRWINTCCTYVDHEDLSTGSLNPVYVNEKFYYMFKGGGGLLVFDPTNQCNECTIIYPLGGPKYIQYDTYLLDFNGELVCIFVDSMECAIAVLKLNESNFRWEEIDDLGENMFFLSQTTCFSRKAVIALMKNKIYFPSLHEKYGVFFCMKDHSYKTFANKEVGANSLQLRCSWIEPTKVQISTTTSLLDWCEKQEQEEKVYEMDDNCNVISDSPSEIEEEEGGEGEGEGEDEEALLSRKKMLLLLLLPMVTVVIWIGIMYFF